MKTNMSSSVKLQSLSNVELISFLEKNGLGEFNDVMRTKVYDGNKLMKLTEFETQLWRPRKSKQQMSKFWKFLTDVKTNPERYFMEEDDEIYENYREDRENKTDIFKKNVSELCNDERFINKLKTALQQKDQDFTSSDSFDSDEEDSDEIYENRKPRHMPKKDKNTEVIPPLPSKPHISPKSESKPMAKSLTGKITASACNKIEESLKKEFMKNQPPLEVQPVKSPYKTVGVDLKIPEVSMTPHYQKKVPLPPPDSDKEDDDDDDMPEYLDIDNDEEVETPKPPQTTEEDTTKRKLERIGNNIKLRPLPALPLLQPEPSQEIEMAAKELPKRKDEVKKHNIQTVPLPPIPPNQSSLPRPPNMLVDLGAIPIDDVKEIEDFNFEQNFVSKYSTAKFYRYTDRKGSEQLLLRPTVKNGTFLLRPSANHYCSLSVKHNDRIYQLALYKGQGTKVIQADVEYESLEAYVEQYKKEPLCLPSTEGYVNVYLTGTLPLNFT